MSETEKKGITVKINADLHAQVRQYIEANGMTMAEFVSKALDDELHPKTTIKEEKYMGNMRTMAFQVPEDLFQQIKDYLDRHHMSCPTRPLRLFMSAYARSILSPGTAI